MGIGLLAVVQQSATATWNLRAIDILTTILLTVLVGLSTWALKTVLAHAVIFGEVNKSLGKINQQLWGVDGQNGHNSEIREIKKSFHRIERYIIRLDSRVQRLEDKTGHTHDRDRLPDDDDPEDDRRG